MNNKDETASLRIWMVDPDPPAWAVDALKHLRLPNGGKTQVELITSAEEWQKKSQAGFWPHIIITEYNLPWLNTADLLYLLSLQPTTTFVAVLSDEPSDEEIKALFESGLDFYMRKTPPRPSLLQARMARRLKTRPPLIQERLNLGKAIKQATIQAKSAAEIASKVLPTLSEFIHAKWGSTFLKDDSGIHVIGAYGEEIKIPPEKIIREDLLAGREAHQLLAEDLPEELRQTFAQYGIHALGFYRLFHREDAEEWLAFGWEGLNKVVRERKQMISELIQWLGAASQRAYSEEIERARRQESEVLMSVILRLNRSLSEEKVAEEVLNGIKRLAPYDRASIWLLTPKGKLKIAAQEGFNLSPAYIDKVVHKFKPPIEKWATVQILFHTHRPLLLDNVHAFHEWHDVLGTKSVQSWIGIPIIYDEQVLGMVFLDSYSPNAFSEGQLKAIQGLMIAAGIALHNARLFAAKTKWQKQSAALRWITLQMVSTLDPQEVIRQFIGEALSLVGAEDVHIFTYDGERLAFLAGEYKGERLKEPYWEPRPNGITYTAARRKEPIIVPDARHHPLYADNPWEGAIISIPLIVRKRLIGVMNIAWDKPREFPDEEIDLLRNLADYAAIALENARLISSLEKRVRDLTELTHLGEKMREMSRGKELAQLVVDKAVALADADVGMIVRQISETEMLIRVVQGITPKIAGTKIPINYGICGRMVEAFEVATFHNLRASEILPFNDEEIPLLKIAVVLPIKAQSKSEPTGCMLVGWKDTEPAVTPETVNTLQLLTSMLANTLERSRAQSELEEAFIQTVTALSRALDERDHYHGGHSERLSCWSAILARELGRPEEEIEIIKQAALLHDIGKIGVPDRILQKAGSLTEEEWKIIRQHPLIGARILRPLERLRPVAEIVEAHHERWDGSGYPYGLKGEEIPLGARIIAVLDSYSAMVDKRVYQDAISHEQAVEEIRRGAGTLYDPRVVEAFLRVADTFKEDKPTPQTGPEKETREKRATDFTENLRESV